MLVRQAEDDLSAQVKDQRDKQKAANEKNRTYQDKRSQYQRLVDAYVAKRHSYTRACHLVADELGVCFDTVRRNTTNSVP